MIAVNAAPGSFQPNAVPTMRRWALEEIGRNSVRPCTRPRTTASNHPMPVSAPRVDGNGRAAGWGRARKLGVGGLRAGPRAPERGGAGPWPPVAPEGRLAYR